MRPVDGCSPDAWCAQSDVFVWWTRAFYAARGHAPRVSFVRPAVCSPAAARVVVFMRYDVVSHVRLSQFSSEVCLEQVRFPPPHVSKCKMASFPSFPAGGLRVLWCSSKRVWTCAWCDGDPFTTAHGHAKRAPPDAPPIWSRNQPTCGGSCSHTRAVHVTVRKQQLSRLSCFIPVPVTFTRRCDGRAKRSTHPHKPA